MRITFVDVSALQHDSAAYLNPAFGLLERGQFIDIQSGKLATFSAPLYPTVLAIFIWFFGLNWLEPLISIQCCILFWTGVKVRRILEDQYPKLAYLGLLFVIFNPNSLAAAHSLQTETFFTFFLLSFVVQLHAFMFCNKVKNLIIATVFLTLATYTRPAGAYVAYAVPLLLLAINFFEQRKRFKDALLSSLIATTVFVALTTPWQIRNYWNFDYYKITSNQGLYLKDNLLIAYNNQFQFDSIAATALFEERYDRFCLENNLQCQTKNPFKQSETLTSFVLLEISNLKPVVIIISFIKSLLLLLVPPGTGLLREAWGIKGLQLGLISSSKGFDGLQTSLKIILESTHIAYQIFFLASLAFSVLLKISAIFGLVKLFKSDQKNLLALIVMCFCTLTILYLFLGQPRFRVPLEPLFAVLAVAGLSLFMERYPASKVPRNTTKS